MINWIRDLHTWVINYYSLSSSYSNYKCCRKDLKNEREKMTSKKKNDSANKSTRPRTLESNRKFISEILINDSLCCECTRRNLHTAHKNRVNRGFFWCDKKSFLRNVFIIIFLSLSLFSHHFVTYLKGVKSSKWAREWEKNARTT